MSETRYTKDHEWVRLDGDVATVGITDHAQEALGDVVFVELPEPGREVDGRRGLRRGRERQGGERRVCAARRHASPRATRPSSTTRRWSTATPPAAAGSSAWSWPTPPRSRR